MTTVYFVRHAESDITVRDGRSRPLTLKGMTDRHLVTEFLADKEIDVILSSPFKRAMDTISEFAEAKHLPIITVEDFRERKSDADHLSGNRSDEFWSFIEHQWADFRFTLSDGECLFVVQQRNIRALEDTLRQYPNQNLVVGTHGTALSTIINYYDCSYGYTDFMAMVNIMPWIVKMVFAGTALQSLEKIDLFQRA